MSLDPTAGPQQDPRTDREGDDREPLPIWRNTRPRGNPDTDRQDLERSQERLEAVLGR